MIHPAQLALILVSMHFVFATEKNIEVFEFDKSDPKNSKFGNDIEGAKPKGTITIDDEKKVVELLTEMTKKGWHGWEQHTTIRESTIRGRFHKYEVYLYDPAKKRFSENVKDVPGISQTEIKKVFEHYPAVVVMPRNPWNY